MQLSRFDVSGADAAPHRSTRSGDSGCGPVKTLLSTACIHDCGYCPNATTGNGRGETGSPEDVVDEFISMRRNGFRGGLFLSSTDLLRRSV